jgi:hypothetical protein
MSSFRFLRVLAVITALTVVFAAPLASAAAASKSNPKKASNNTVGNGSTSQSVAQGYGTNQPLQNGMIVKLVDKDSSKVEPLTQATATKMQGVVVSSSDTTINLSNTGNNGQVFVATFGHYDVLVSNQNGPIKAGDYVTISSLAGVGMKVDTDQPTVIGKATADFSGSGQVAGSAKLKDSTGKQITVSLGRIPVDISISHNPLQQLTANGLPSFLQHASEAVAGKPVDPTRVYIALVVLVAGSLVAGAILYSGVRGGLISIGRNPMAKKYIVSGMIRVVVSGLIVFVLSVFGVYLLLKL